MPIALVASVSAATANTASVTTGAIDTTGASFIVIGVASFASGGNPSPTDSKSNSWSALTARVSNNTRVKFFYCENPTVGSGHTFSLSASSSYCALVVFAFSGVRLSSSFDAENGAGQNSGTSQQPGAVTPAVDNEVIVSIFGFNATETPSIDLSFSTPVTVAFVNNVNFGLSMAYLVETTAASKNPTWSYGTNTDSAAAIACFKTSLFSDSIALGNSDGVSFAATQGALSGITVATSDGISFATNIAAQNSFALGSGDGLSFAVTVAAVCSGITAGVSAGESLGYALNLVGAVTIGVASLAETFLRVVDAQLTVGVFAAFVLEEAVPAPDSFRPFNTSGQPGVFKADQLSGTPGSFKPASGISAPGFFKPKA